MSEEVRAGRPTKLNDEMIEKANHYVDHFEEYGDPVPSVEGLAMELRVHRSTLYDWASKKDHPFSDILERCNQQQTRTLFRGSLVGDMNANITKLMLGKQGYSEKSIQELTGANGGAIKTESKVEWVVNPVKPVNEA